jgi:hypothetical protein
MAFCQNCGAKLPDGVKFCPSCGTPVTPAAPPAPPAPVPEAPRAVPEQPASPAQPYVPQEPAQQAVPQTPPAQPYTPPQTAQQAPPAQQYAPQQQSVPQQTAYNPPPPVPPVGTAVRANPGGGRFNTIPFLIGLAADVLIVALIVVLGILIGKGGKNNVSKDPNAGVWTAVSGEMSGVSLNIADVYSGGFTIELKDKGKCVITIDGTSANGKWTLDDGEFHAEGGGVKLDGTIEGNTMTLENVQDSGLTLTLTKDGASAVPDGSGSTAVSGDAGRYVLTKLVSDEIEFNEKDLASMGMGGDYLLLNGDGTGEMRVGDTVTNITWGDGKVTYNSMPCPYEHTDDDIVVHMGANDYTYTLETAAKADSEMQGVDASASAASSSAEAFVSPTVTLDDGSEWYGLQYATNFEGSDSEDLDDDVWGYLGTDDDGREFLELYDKEDYQDTDESPILSIWVKRSDTRLDADIDDTAGDCWLYDMDLTPDENEGLSSDLENGMLTLTCRYVTDKFSCDLTFFLRELGTPWDEANDPLPPGYDDYKKEYDLPDTASGSSSSSMQATNVFPSGDGMLPAKVIKACRDSLHDLSIDDSHALSYADVVKTYLQGVDGQYTEDGTSDDGSWVRYDWYAEEDSSKMLDIVFEDTDGDGIYTFSGNMTLSNFGE